MGKTRLTYRDRVQHAREQEWNSFRKALRADAQDRFDHLWDNAQLYSMAAGSHNHCSVCRRALRCVIVPALGIDIVEQITVVRLLLGKLFVIGLFFVQTAGQSRPRKPTHISCG